MIFKLDQNNSLRLDFKNGGKILKLILNGITIITSQQHEHFLGSGSFLMFPWVSSLRQYNHPHTFSDWKNRAVHGHCANKPRTYIQTVTQDKITIKMNLQVKNDLVPLFEQIFILSRGKLEIQFEVLEEKQKNIYCFGYHPYFEIDKYLLSQLIIETDVELCLELDQVLLPKFPFEKCIKKINLQNKYNNLFQGGSFFTIRGPKGQTLKIVSDLGYWQIYTPDQKRIAIQPISFCGNIYEILSQYSLKLPDKGNIVISVQNNIK